MTLRPLTEFLLAPAKRRTVSACLTVSTALFAACSPGQDATRSDAGTLADAASSCDEDEGEAWCQDETLLSCDGTNSGLVEVDCATVFPGSPATCGPSGGDGDASNACTVKTGYSCLIDRHGQREQLPCTGTRAGCVVRGADRCEQNVGTCTPENVGACWGDNLVLGCTQTQPLVLACASIGTSCRDAACRGVAIGVECVPGLLECESGAECVEQIDDRFICVPRSDDCPAGCASPPANTCRWSFGRYTSLVYDAQGVCQSPPTDDCWYPVEEAVCAEDCISGVCVPGSSCGLTTGCDAPLGCKVVSGAEMRCIPVDDAAVGAPCDDDVPGLRCDSHQMCIWPSFETTSVCGRLCLTATDCGGSGLLGQGVCVRDGTAGSFYGYCR